jgi:hypothetical protein
VPATPAAPAKRPRAKAAPKTAAIPPQLLALGLVPPVIDTTTGDSAAPDAETSYLEPGPPAYEPRPVAEPEPASAEATSSFLEPDPPVFRDVAPAVATAATEAAPVEEPTASVEPAPSVAAAFGAAPAALMSGVTYQDDPQSTKLEQRLARLAPAAAPPPAAAEPVIGAPDVQLFDCPSCGRPLERGTTKCTNCGTRLVGGRPMRRVATFAGIAVVAVLALGAVGMTALAMAPSQPATGGVPTGSTTPSQVAATGAAPSQPPTTPGVPVGAAAALTGTGLINARISTDAGKLAATLADATVPTVDVARAMRALAADAQQGIDLSSRLAPWTDAAPVAAKLDAFYRGLADRARDALRASLNDAGAYRSAGADLLSLVRGLAEVDAASRALATGAGISLPPLGDPGSVSAAPSS